MYSGQNTILQQVERVAVDGGPPLSLRFPTFAAISQDVITNFCVDNVSKMMEAASRYDSKKGF